MTNNIPKPRYTFVLVRAHKTKSQKIGEIIMPKMNSQNYMTGEVMALGPGTYGLGTSDEKTETHDLKVGQRVWIRHKQTGPGGQTRIEGIETTVHGEQMWMFEQGNVLLILDQPGEWTPDDEDDRGDEPGDTSPIVMG